MIDSHLRLSKKEEQFSSEHFNPLSLCPDKDFDDILVLASQLCRSSVAAIIGITNQEPWIKSIYGIEDTETFLHPCFWRPVMEQEKILGIEDIKKYPEFALAKEFTFYAGVPLITRNKTVGVLYVADKQPGAMNGNQRVALDILSRQVLNQVDYHKQHNELLRVQQKLQERYKELEKFSSVVSHDIKSPLANIISLTELLRDENQGNFDDDALQYLDFLIQSSYSLRSYVDGILTFYRSEKILEKENEDVSLPKLLKGIADLYQVNAQVNITYPAQGSLHKVNKAALTQIFMNLISNALKYNNKPNREVKISFAKSENFYHFEVQDNGNGIPKEDFEKIFELFTTLNHNDRDGNHGSGIGLATVHKLISHMDGYISLDSELNQGSNFKFKIKRL
ncbi:sensor histidine kinase [Salinimicrobium sp. GXAS 041]|uniref:sensor histidine kinase n=1 Tax=Salinimicrobium sp. GXAS 041 TaxID=3400806 RepID=UPI003C7166E5